MDGDELDFYERTIGAVIDKESPNLFSFLGAAQTITDPGSHCSDIVMSVIRNLPPMSIPETRNRNICLSIYNKSVHYVHR